MKDMQKQEDLNIPKLNEDIENKKIPELKMNMEFASELIKDKKISFLINNLDKFKDLDFSIAKKIIENNAEEMVAKNLESFKKEDHLVICKEIVNKTKEEQILQSLEKSLDSLYAMKINKDELDIFRKIN